MTSPSRPEVWLRGPVPGVPAPLQPVAHALLQAVEDADRLTAELATDVLWTRPGGAASVGFHLRHMAGSLDRLMTYARDEPLTEAQRAVLSEEKEHTPEVGAAELLERLRSTVDRALEQLRSTDPETLDDSRLVGRAALPSSVRGLLHHAGEHTARHAGQISSTVRILGGSLDARGSGASGPRAG
jgi:uncharacterized damage-inducible protein DinB